MVVDVKRPVILAVLFLFRGHFDPRIFELKPHPGEIRCAGWIREDLEFGEDGDFPPPARLQDRCGRCGHPALPDHLPGH